jgi:hypothetical protein
LIPNRIIISGILKGRDSFLNIEGALTEARSRIVNKFSRSLNVSYARLPNDHFIRPSAPSCS